jgi:hypothetical protein
MATRFIHMGLPLEQSPYAGVAPFAVDDEGVLKVVRGAANKGALSADPGEEPISVDRLIVATASLTLTAADHGATVIADSTTSVVVSLPATQKGLKFTLCIKQLTAAGGHAFSPVAVDKILINGKADDEDYVCSAASDALGDFVTLIGDGVDGWYVASQNGTWA